MFKLPVSRVLKVPKGGFMGFGQEYDPGIDVVSPDISIPSTDEYSYLNTTPGVSIAEPLSNEYSRRAEMDASIMGTYARGGGSSLGPMYTGDSNLTTGSVVSPSTTRSDGLLSQLASVLAAAGPSIAAIFGKGGTTARTGINPSTGQPYGAINPLTGKPYEAALVSSGTIMGISTSTFLLIGGGVAAIFILKGGKRGSRGFSGRKRRRY